MLGNKGKQANPSGLQQSQDLPKPSLPPLKKARAKVIESDTVTPKPKPPWSPCDTRPTPPLFPFVCYGCSLLSLSLVLANNKREIQMLLLAGVMHLI